MSATETGWIATADQIPTRADSDESGLVWIDDGLQVTVCPWHAVPHRKSTDYWQPRAPRHKPCRARRFE